MVGSLLELAQLLEMPLDLLKTIVAMFSSILLSPLYRLITGRSARNAFSIVVGFGLLFFMIEEWAFFILAGILLPYLLCHAGRPFLVSAICSFILLLIVHGYRFVTNYYVWKVDCSVTIMLLVTKLTYYAKWLQKKDREAATLTDYLAYHLFVPSVVAGPTFSFEVYLAFINNKFDTSFKSMRVGSAFQPLLVALALISLFTFIQPYFHSRWVLQNAFYLSLSLPSKALLMNVVGFFYRLKYYTAWYLAQGATNLSGLSLDAEGGYSSVCAVSLKFETESNVRTRTEYWNASMQLWLKDVVYEALKERASERVAFFGTFLASAFWHGLYLTYYVGFVYWGMLLQINKWAYKWSQAFPKLAATPLAKVAAWAVGGLFLNYIGMFLTVLNWEDAVAFHADIHYWGTFALLALMAASFVLRPPRAKAGRKSE